MSFTSTIRNSAFAALAIFAANSAPAFAQVNQDSVKDARGNNVVDARGNCVRSKWETANDLCGNDAGGALAGKKKLPGDLTAEERVVYFAFDSSKLTKQEQRKLDTIASVLKSSKGLVSANVVGYADQIGTNAYNEKLSMRRARTVQDYLAKKGFVDNKKAQVRGLGETDSQSRCDGITNRGKLIECLWKDRRVEVQLQLRK
jgi:outer membrane protein OmpA-like peptidoglycan-associated protein